MTMRNPYYYRLSQWPATEQRNGVLYTVPSTRNKMAGEHFAAHCLDYATITERHHADGWVDYSHNGTWRTFGTFLDALADLRGEWQATHITVERVQLAAPYKAIPHTMPSHEDDAWINVYPEDLARL